MGIYLNPGNEGFRSAIISPVYVDKTELIKETNKALFTEGKCIALSHARRFGKSQVARMLDAYYSRGCNSREMFSKFKITNDRSYEEHLNKYNVIHIDVASAEDSWTEDLVEKISAVIIEDIKKECGNQINYDKTLQHVLLDVFEKTGIPFVIIIDEWDCIVRNHSDRPDLVHKYLQFLHCLFKSEESTHFLALGYITGILPIKKIDNESALNNFREYTMISSKNLTPYFGFTEDEVRALCQQHDMDFASVKEWYNGYLIDGKHMYNPNSVYQAMVDHSLESYWKNTSSFGAINKYITLNYDGLKENILRILAHERISVNVDNFKNDLSVIASKDDALTALIHLGYLGYDAERGQAYLPNYEVGTAYKSALQTGNWKEIADTISECDRLLWATIDKEADQVAQWIELAHEAYTSVFEYNDENSLSCVVTMAYFTAPAYYNVVRELPTGKGFADLAFIPRSDSGNKPAIIVELKWDKDADTAINQIKNRRYTGKLAGYGKEVILVGISYNKDAVGDDAKKHSCVIETVEM